MVPTTPLHTTYRHVHFMQQCKACMAVQCAVASMRSSCRDMYLLYNDARKRVAKRIRQARFSWQAGGSSRACHQLQRLFNDHANGFGQVRLLSGAWRVRVRPTTIDAALCMPTRRPQTTRRFLSVHITIVHDYPHSIAIAVILQHLTHSWRHHRVVA